MDSSNTISESSFILLALESIKYILSKKQDAAQSKEEITQLGEHVGQRISNHLINFVPMDFSNNKKDVMYITQIIKFLGKDVWDFLFGKKITLHMNVEGVYFLDTQDLKIHYLIYSDKNNANDEKTDAILDFLCGILKGVIDSFNIENKVTATVTYQKGTYFYTFKVNILNFTELTPQDLKKLNENKNQ